MTSMNKVSQESDRSLGERDVSARATHLKAATGKVSVTTIERKIMSTKTTIKRIALVAAASLGLGVMSVIPAQAVGNADVLTATAGTQNTVAAGGSHIADSGTAAYFTFQFLGSSSAIDTYTLRAVLKSAPSTSSALPYIMLDTATVAGVSSSTGNAMDTTVIDTRTVKSLRYDTLSANSNFYVRNTTAAGAAASGIAYVKVRVMVDQPTVAGTYVVTIFSDPVNTLSSDNVPATGTDVTITVSGVDTSVSPTYSTASMALGSSYTNVATLADSVVAVANTASTTAAAVIRVKLLNSSNVGTYANESVTISTTAGTVGLLSVGSVGRTATFNYTAGANGTDFGIYPDGTAGTATITITTPSVTFATKSVTFYSTTVAKIVATKAQDVLVLGSNSNVVLGKATDANGNVVGSDATSTGVYAYSSNTAVISDSGTACTYDTTYQIHKCSLTAVASGTATITLRNSSTKGAAATVNSAEAISVTVNTNPAATLKMAWNKTSYAPGEKAYLLISAADSAGNPVAGTVSNLINAAGISYTSSFTGTLPTLTATSYSLAGVTPLLGGSVTSTTPVSSLTFYMPTTGSTADVSATGGTSLPVAGQVKVTASATLSNDAATALAAVTALASQVSAFITKINAQITTLTDLVMKIQKKVKA